MAPCTLRREGRQTLTDAIRTELVRDGTLGERAMVATVFGSVGLTDAARARAASYRPGTVVIFRKVGRTERRVATPATASGLSTPRAAPSGCLTPRGRRSPGPPVIATPPMPMPSPRCSRSSAPATRCSSPATITRPSGSMGAPPRWSRALEGAQRHCAYSDEYFRSPTGHWPHTFCAPAA